MHRRSVILFIGWLLVLSLPVFAVTESPHGEIKLDCAQCHSATSWKDSEKLSRFDHKTTGYELTGAHQEVKCAACHLGLKFTETSQLCADCHTDFHQGELGNDCRSCHNTASFTDMQDILGLHASRGFPLSGKHAVADCEACHRNQQREEFAGTGSECRVCHQETFANTVNPDHAAAQFSLDCLGCHNSDATAWLPSTFEHPPTVVWQGAHLGLDCASCHTEQYVGTTEDCFTCHQNDFENAADPDHVAGNFDHDCTSCHTMQAWTPTSFDHNLTDFPLAGAHLTLECQACHSESYTGTPLDCYTCHQDAFATTSEPDHVAGNFDHDCAGCHNVEAWQPATFDHNQTGFALTGAHLTTACQDCHTEGYVSTPTDCFSCHGETFLATTDPAHEDADFSHDCTQCHSTTAWEPADFDHNLTEFALTGTHTTLQCQACHSTGYTGTPPDCYSCHATAFAGTDDPDHESSGFPHDCTQCHTTAAWEPADFDHNLTEFALSGAHTTLQCEACHSDGYTGTPLDCFSCHETAFAGTDDPDHESSGFPHDCAQCHTTAAWEPADFDHNLTEFALTGAHATLQCEACHSDGYTGTALDCYSCHATAFAGTDDPDHESSGFPHDCTQCHTTAAWEPATFDHNLTEFALTGAHASLQCLACHAESYTGTPLDCYSCHATAYAATSDPHHDESGFPHDCTQCHTTAAWEPSNFSHDQTGFSLTGAHTTLDCQSCHADGYAGTATDCIGCHQVDFASVVDPDHETNNFSTDCVGCHNTSAWTPSSFDHNETGFALTGAHSSLNCIACHGDGYVATPNDCYSCHGEIYAATASPQHSDAGFSIGCVDCHTTTAWEPASWDHSSTGFALTGAHQTQECIACHADGYTNTDPLCYSCHAIEYAGVVDPDHEANSFDHNCATCHSTTAWQPPTFDHNLTGFSLTGAHTTLQCQACHSEGYAGTAADCFSCHSAAYASATDPDHEANNFDHDCTTCHSTSAWEPATFDHNLTAFALTGAHATLQCQACHSAGYTGTPIDCYSCHADAFAGADDPDHEANNFDHDCTTCHSTSAWEPATFDHNLTAFALTGAHATLQCQACHSAGYTGTPIDCYSCHADAFAGADDPDHEANNFDHDCTTCHSTSAWEPAEFDHTQTGFALTGAHTTLACIACHADGYSNTPNLCYDCHDGDYASVSDPNHVSNNFSQDCTGCHSTSAWSPATFDHTQTGFALTGAHTTLACIACHADGYSNTPNLCYDCHDGDYASVSDPNHVSNNFSQDCTGCHSTSAWSPATFDHTQTGFALTGAHLALACLACHSGGYAGTSPLCFACHESAYDATSDPDHAAAQFPTECESCHTTAAWTPANWDHDAMYFPIYSGTHRNEWNLCTDCHVIPSDYSTFECIDCHEHNQSETDDDHSEVGGYSYNSIACLTCHPDGND